MRLCNEPAATARLRNALDEVARRSHLSDEARFELKLAATEALTNAVKGRPGGHAVDVSIQGGDGAVEVVVMDRGRFVARTHRSDRIDESEGGRGIPLMLALVDQVEFASLADGTRVRMRKESA
ncbi:MAG TPA: ATP-binding protein [Gaiellaceae bacterium]|nr:ATP-binding protein [Gaiellaceae bacterium]